MIGLVLGQESGSSEGGGEHRTTSSEGAGEHGGSGSEGTEGGSGGDSAVRSGANALALDEIYDVTRNGARLILRYDAAANQFVGAVENKTNATLTRVRVEIHLSNGVELGPRRRPIWRRAKSWTSSWMPARSPLIPGRPTPRLA